MQTPQRGLKIQGTSHLRLPHLHCPIVVPLMSHVLGIDGDYGTAWEGEVVLGLGDETGLGASVRDGVWGDRKWTSVNFVRNSGER